MSIKRYMPLLAGCMVLAAGTAAYADCEEELATLRGGGISKDGSLAPLQTEGDAGADAAVTTETAGDEEGAAAEGVAKDGTQAPLEDRDSDASDVAASGEAAQAQQEAGADETAGDPRSDAIAKAEEALAAGDEEACMAAVEEARNL